MKRKENYLQRNGKPFSKICRISISWGATPFKAVWKGEGWESWQIFCGIVVVIFCYEEFEKYALWKSVSQAEATFIVYSEPI